MKHAMNICLPVVCVCIVGTEEIYVVFKLQLENEFTTNSIRLCWLRDRVSNQRQTCQWHIVLATSTKPSPW